MTNDELKKAKEICEKATPGPWENRCREFSNTEKPRNIWSEYGYLCKTENCHQIENADFIAESRTLLPKAIDEIERLNSDNLKFRLALEWYAHKQNYFDGVIGEQIKHGHHIEWKRDNGEKARTALKQIDEVLQRHFYYPFCFLKTPQKAPVQATRLEG